jgi:F0F1-type ATP synthase assembly protein I
MKKRARPSAASQGVDQAWAAVTTMIGGFAVWGGVGWLLDRWWGTKFALPIGVILGMALGVYAVVVRYGIAATPVDARSDTAPRRPQGQGEGVGAASGAIGTRSGSGEPGPTPSDSSTPTRAVPGSAPTGSER